MRPGELVRKHRYVRRADIDQVESRVGRAGKNICRTCGWAARLRPAAPYGQSRRERNGPAVTVMSAGSAARGLAKWTKEEHKNCEPFWSGQCRRTCGRL